MTTAESNSNYRGEQLPTRCTRVAAKGTTVIPPRSENLIPCGEASLAIIKGQERFTRRSQLLVTDSCGPNQ